MIERDRDRHNLTDMSRYGTLFIQNCADQHTYRHPYIRLAYIFIQRSATVADKSRANKTNTNTTTTTTTTRRRRRSNDDVKDRSQGKARQLSMYFSDTFQYICIFCTRKSTFMFLFRFVKSFRAAQIANSKNGTIKASQVSHGYAVHENKRVYL